ncbi:sulfite exporter TauE/SafE family protein [Brooklawnia cerclae]|uniref:Probable membrane transporter protein n=1 Tax=Brooklawnia cerclae TaxID=349934 RepID=A0ABX0SIT2_9ACTN|nr:sulfite exporter TauE/SafE family protein [Brooklawnia cerclae]NIH57218.1 hypothetical protein [Brooklawnia cerclae]
MHVTIESVVLLLAAGLGAGLIGYLTGLASLVSYPALLAVGLGPLSANVTNTLSLVGVGAGATLRAGREAGASGRRRTIQQCVVCALGGTTGAIALLATGEQAFEAIVPWLIAFASLTLLASPRIRTLRGKDEKWPAYLAVLFVVCVYGGYFGAGAGVVYFAVVLVLTNFEWSQTVLMKTILLSVSNLAASLVFIGFAPVDWLAAGIMFVGQLAGGNLGPLVQRYVPEKVSRWVIAAAGFYLAWSLLP